MTYYNKRLLKASIIDIFASILLLVLFHGVSIVYVVILLASSLFSLLASFNRTITAIPFILSLTVPLALVFFSGNLNLLSIPYLIPVFLILLGLPGLAVPCVWEVIMIAGSLITYELSSFSPTMGQLSLPFLLSSFTTLAFANIVAASGKGYPIVIVQRGIPSGSQWEIEVNGVVKKVNGQKLVLEEKKVEFRVCPSYAQGKYFLPDRTSGVVKEGRKAVISFTPSDTLPYDRYPHCFATFFATGLPSNIQWSINVGGYEYVSSNPSSPILVPILGSKDAQWKAKEIKIGEVIFKPTIENGVINRGDRITINYTSVVEPKKPLQLPSLDKWDPKVWVGNDIYGYNVVSVLGIGGNGYVLKSEKDGVAYAIKVLSMRNDPSQTRIISASSFDDLFRESENLKELSKNPRFVRIYGIYVDINNITSALKGNSEAYFKYPPAIIMEFMEGGTAADLAKTNLVYSPQWPLIVKNIIREISLALNFLHKNGYVHLDVKPQNIFFTKKLGSSPDEVLKVLSVVGNVKLGDLGSAVKVGQRFNQATPAYSPPEQIEAIILGRGASPSMDVFALGITAYYLLTLRNDNPAIAYLNHASDLYISGRINEALNYINQARSALASWRLQLPPNVPQELVTVIYGCVNPDYTKRYTSEQIASILSK
ncbi:serine/threonine-protein kinase [Stygiolobus caldivivus]|uniref:Serine/threonine protein kinase n=1 Tax=Stygiolobus caldivivus TaxID=2824673 RepID=A0A8D5U8U1_9CREN|nr:serine/threonine-protein kinase [Stygiolobus caldivivus]BCU71062.1 serine/threonine protein kinase [Stygiolobus caldivivus]